MRLLLFFLLAMLPSCAPPSALHRGTTTTRPPTPPLRPGHGAPVMGQPGASSHLPRSPHVRVLPPSKEPGLWSGDRVRASTDDLPVLEVMGVTLTAPADVAKYVRQAAEHCAKATKNSTVTQGLVWADTIDPGLLRCLILKGYSLCAEILAGRAIAKQVDAAPDYRRWALGTIDGFRRACRGHEASEGFRERDWPFMKAVEREIAKEPVK